VVGIVRMIAIVFMREVTRGAHVRPTLGAEVVVRRIMFLEIVRLERRLTGARVIRL